MNRPREGADELARRSDEIRHELHELVDELSQRKDALGRWLGRSLVVGGAVVGVGLVSALAWRFARGRGARRPRWIARRREVPGASSARGGSLTRRIAGSAVEALVAVASRELALRLLSPTPRRE
jgi:hypothetical protein